MTLEPGDLLLTGTPEGVAVSGRSRTSKKATWWSWRGPGWAGIEGLVAALTGGASGIGAATLRVLRERGAKVAALDLDPAAEGELSVITDVTDDASVRRVAARTASEPDGSDPLLPRRAAPPGAVLGTRHRQHRLGRGDGRTAGAGAWIDRLLAKTGDPEAELAALNARQPHGRLVTAEEVADAVAYLASPRSGSTAGTGLAR